MEQHELYALYESNPAPIAEFLQYLRQSYSLPDTPRCLDMGCGPGRLLAPLSSLGWEVTGYEPDPDYAAAAQRVADRTPGTTVELGGFQALAESSRYDLIAAVNGPFSYLLDPEMRRDAIERCAAALRPGGVLFLELANFWWILKNYRTPPDLELDVHGTAVTRSASHDFDYHDGLMVHRDTFSWRDDTGTRREVTKVHRMAFIGFSEIRFMLDQAGFRNLRTYNDYGDRSPARLTGKKLMVAASIGGR